MVDGCGKWAVLLAAACALLAGCAPRPNPVEFSPAGDRLVFPWGPQDVLHEVRADGTGLRQLPGTEQSSGPRWSPKGDVVAFNQEDDLVLYDVSRGQAVHRIAGGRAPVAWAPDGERLGVFRQLDDHLAATWYRLPELRAGAVVPLPLQRVSAAQTPQWLESRDGMAFMAADADVYNVYTVEGDDLYRITNTGDVLGFGLAADREHLLWARGNTQVKDGGMTLWSYDLQRRSVRRLPFHATFTWPAGQPQRVSPVVAEVQFAAGGSELALVLERPRTAVEVWTCRLDGSEARLVERAPVVKGTSKREGLAYDSLSPCWSPDGKRLAVVRSGVRAGIRVYGPAGEPAVQIPLPRAPVRGG